MTLNCVQSISVVKRIAPQIYCLVGIFTVVLRHVSSYFPCSHVRVRSLCLLGHTKNHPTQWRTYLLFCLYFLFHFLPPAVHTVCLFSQFLSRSLTPASVHNYLSGVKFLHVALGHHFPSIRTFSIKITLRGTDRMALHCPKGMPPVTPSILFSLIQLSCSVDSSPEYIPFSCAFLFAFFVMARISNIVPFSTRSFDSRKHLCRGDIISAPHGLTVAFKWSKTNETGKRHLLLP